MERSQEISEARAVIDRVKAHPFAPRLQRVQGSYLFDVAGAGTWRIDVDHGKVTFREGVSTADCIVRAEAGDFCRIARGEQNLITAFMQGRVMIEGDPALA